MALEDLQQIDINKDISKSCIFDFPDRPPDSLPPDPPPIDPPICFPYCPSDDWVPPLPPVIPPILVIPPGVIIHPGINFTGVEFDTSVFNAPPVAIFTLKTEVSLLGELTDVSLAHDTHAQYLGGAGTELDNITNLTREFDSGFGKFTFTDFIKILAEFPDAYLSIRTTLNYAIASPSQPLLPIGDIAIGIANAVEPDTIQYSYTLFYTNNTAVFDCFIFRDTSVQSLLLVNGVQVFPV